MTVARSLEALERNRKEILASWRGEAAVRPETGMLSPSGIMRTTATYGRVASIVAEDAIHGPHLMVRRQHWSGSPPAPSDAAGASVRCHPAPGRTINDYGVDDFVRIAFTHGAVVAERLA